MTTDYPFHRGGHDDLPFRAIDRYRIPFVHLSLLTVMWIPYGWIVGPLFFNLTVGNRDPLVHRESLKALNFAITITLLSLAVHVYGVIDGKTPDMETPCLWDQLVLALGFVVVLWATFLGWCRIPVGYPAIPFIRKPKPSTDIVLREPPG